MSARRNETATHMISGPLLMAALVIGGLLLGPSDAMAKGKKPKQQEQFIKFEMKEVHVSSFKKKGKKPKEAKEQQQEFMTIKMNDAVITSRQTEPCKARCKKPGLVAPSLPNPSLLDGDAGGFASQGPGATGSPITAGAPASFGARATGGGPTIK